MHVDTIIAEMEAEMPQYKTANLFDRASLYRWASLALKEFGQSIMTLQEAVVEVKGGRGHLPDNYFSLYFAVKCSAKGYYCKEEDKSILQNSLIWKERIERSQTWNSCDPCCKEEEEKTIIENIYLNEKLVSFYYDCPMPLTLGKRLKKSGCAKNCRNLSVYECPHEIDIDKTTLHANFTDGTVYLQYYGLDTDSGVPIIPDTPKRYVERYVEAYLHKRFFERLLKSGDDVNVIGLYQNYVFECNDLLPKAMRDAKFQSLTPESYKKVKQNNAAYMARYEYMLPRF